MKNKTLLFLIYFLGILFVFAVPTFLIKLYSMPSGSMEDTLLVGDCLVVCPGYYGISLFHRTSRFFKFHEPQRGDVMALLYPPDKSKVFTKRCIGIPGDVVQMKDMKLYVNGVLVEEPYVKHLMTAAQALAMEGASSKKVNFGPVTVGGAEYFVLGDNRDDSSDSRYWGSVDEKLLKGKAGFIYLRDGWFHFEKIK